jgi:ABC-type transport system involved in multi-copper enzyme maturation permease subunit
MKLVVAELRKLRYSKSTYGLTLASIFIATLSTVVTPIVIADDETGLFGSLSDQAMVDGVYANAVSSYIFAIILGILIMSGEFRHGTAVATFLASPKRERVLGTKLLVAAFAGALMQIISVLIAVAAGWYTLTFFEDVAAPSDDVFLNLSLAAMLSGAVLAVVGVAIGSLIRNQLIAIVSTLVWLFIVEPIILLLFADAGKWLPTVAITGMLAIEFESAAIGISTADYLTPGVATLVLLAYGAIFSFVALVTSMRRDID